MKKLLLGIAGLMLMAVIVILFTNASNNKPIEKKATTELTKSGCCPEANNCSYAKGGNQSCCDKEKCDEMKCNPDDCNMTNCDPASCPKHANEKMKEPKNCDPATCQGHCPSK